MTKPTPKPQKTITIEPIDGRSLPRHDDPKRRITKRTVVPDNRYYRRAVRREDVRQVDEKKPSKSRSKENAAG